MSMPSRLSNYLLHCGARYELVSHTHSHSSAETARAAHVAPHQLAKSVILEDQQGCVMAVVPADAQVDVDRLARMLGRSALHLSDEKRISELFTDCALGAVPAIGMAWGMETVVDEALEANPEVFFEAGDHEMLLRMSHEQFCQIMRDARQGEFCKTMAH
jgi:Ala-tRNA(Pro) deacylase